MYISTRNRFAHKMVISVVIGSVPGWHRTFIEKRGDLYWFDRDLRHLIKILLIVNYDNRYVLII